MVKRLFILTKIGISHIKHNYHFINQTLTNAKSYKKVEKSSLFVLKLYKPNSQMRENPYREDREELKELLRQYQNLKQGKQHSFLEDRKSVV